jgi:hypothetical protein
VVKSKNVYQIFKYIILLVLLLCIQINNIYTNKGKYTRIIAYATFSLAIISIILFIIAIIQEYVKTKKTK